MTGKDHSEIRNWLVGRGYSPEEVATIMSRLDQFDARITREALFDGMVTGGLDIDAIVRDVLKDAREGRG